MIEEEEDEGEEEQEEMGEEGKQIPFPVPPPFRR